MPLVYLVKLTSINVIVISHKDIPEDNIQKNIQDVLLSYLQNNIKLLEIKVDKSTQLEISEKKD